MPMKIKACIVDLPLGIPSTHTYIPLMCVGHEKQNELHNVTLFSYFKLGGDAIKFLIFSDLMAFCI
jgi:hypothetical protein